MSQRSYVSYLSLGEYALMMETQLGRTLVSNSVPVVNWNREAGSMGYVGLLLLLVDSA